MQGPVAIILISWNVTFIWETGYWTRAIKRFALFDLLKSLYSDTKILSKYIPSLLSLRLKVSGCHYNSIYNNTWTKEVKQFSKQHQTQWSKCLTLLRHTLIKKYFWACTKSGSLRFHSFQVVDRFCLFIYLRVLTFSLLDCSEFGNFVITLICQSQ
jgi:hypothetical protein